MKKIYFIAITLLSLLYSSCKHEPDLINPNEIKDSVQIQYIPDTLLVEQGVITKSLAPVLVGNNPINLLLSSEPLVQSGYLSIDSTGVICVDSLVDEGIYNTTVIATNIDGSFTFKDVLTIVVSSTPVVPSGLLYSPNNMVVASGQNVSTSEPSYTGSSPITFSITTTPSNANFTIDGNGVISIIDSIPNGIYSVDVGATNSVGSSIFTSAFTFEITGPSGLSNLTYAANSLTLSDGETGESVLPTIEGTSPVSYSIEVLPATSDVSIDANTGQISVDNPLAIGTYTITVNATNSIGTVVFEDVYTIIVEPLMPSNLQYSPNSLGLVLGSEGSSSVPTIEGSATITYSINVSPSTTEISINSETGVITASSSTLVGSYIVDVTATNTAGSELFSSIFSINISASAEVPSNLVYSPNSFSVDFGSSGTSNAPTVSGTTPITFSMISSPISAEISIDSGTGVISSSESAPTGVYNITVTASNTAGNVDFADVYSITVNSSVAPSNLSYNPSSVTITEGSSSSSGNPTISGSTPISYTLSVIPFTSEISIDASTGIITGTSSLTPGSYLVSVDATNSAGTTSFTDAFTIVVEAVVTEPSSLIYSPNSITLNEGIAGTSATPTVSGTTPMTYTFSPAVTGVSINTSTGVISIATSTAVGSYSLTVTATNSGGSTTASYSITVNAAATLISFASDILPIINSNCGGCHLPGGTRADYTDYTNSFNNAATIANRVKGIGAIMPKAPNSPLSQAEIDLIDQWITDGKQP